MISVLFIQIFRKYFIWTLVYIIYIFVLYQQPRQTVNCHTLAVAFWLSLNVTYLTLPLFLLIFHIFARIQHKANKIIASFSCSQCQRKTTSQCTEMLFAVRFKSVFLFPHTEKADKIPSWVEIALQSSKTTFLHAFRKLVEKFVQLTIIGNQFMVFKRRSGKAGCAWLLRLRKRTNPICLEFSLFSEASVPPREFLWCCLWLLPL